MYLRLDLSVRNQVTVERIAPAVQVVAAVGHAQALEIIAAALLEWKIQPADVKGIVVVVGVGSFTATRVATTIANAWAYVHQVPVLGVTSEEVFDLNTAEARFAAAPRFLSATYSGAPAIGKAAT